MLNILNRFIWIFIFTVLTIFIVIGNGDLFIIGIIIAVIIKVLLNNNFLTNNLEKYRENLIKEILESINTKGVNFSDKVKHEINEKIPVAISQEKVSHVDGSFSFDDTIVDEENIKIEEFNNPSLSFEEEKIKNNVVEKIEEKKEQSKIGVFFSEFFAENLMAKIGGILLAIGVIFLMSIFYAVVGPVTKIVIGFALGFGIYFIGILMERRGFKTEGMVLLGTGILINYIVILSGRFLIGDGDGILSTGINFLLLIMNTVFSIVTSFVHNSKNLLLFSIIFAYIIPFITGLNDSTPYLIVGYGLILSLGGLAIGNYLSKEGDNNTSLQILYSCLIGGNILFMNAPFQDSVDFVAKMIGFNIVNFIAIFMLYKNKFEKNILSAFIISYIFLFLIIFSGAALTGFGILISFIFATLGLLFFSTFFIVTSVGTGLIYLLFIPLLFAIGFISMGGVGAGIILMPIFLISYLIIFAFGVGNILSNNLKYLFFIFVGLFLSIGNSYLRLNFDLDIYSFSTMFVTSFIFLFSTYYLSGKKDLSYLYAIGTVASIFILSPIIQITGDFTQLSILAIIIFGILNFIIPFVNKNLVEEGTQNLIVGMILGIIFVGLNLARYGLEYFPGVTMGYAFLGLAILYFTGGFIFFNKLGVDLEKTDEKAEGNKNVVYTLLGLAISLFSVSIALIFSTMPAIITMIWLFQSSVLFFFSNKLNNKKIYAAAIIIFIIGLIKFLDLTFDTLFYTSKNILGNNVVSIGFIIISLILNVNIFKNTKLESVNFVSVLHILGIIIVNVNLMEIFDFNDIGELFIYMGIFFFVLTLIYNYINNSLLKKTLFVFISIFLVYHTLISEDFRTYGFNYIYTIIMGSIIAINYYFDKKNNKNIFIYCIYFFIITSIYLYHYTEDNFSLTIYWGILSIIGIYSGFGVQKKTIRSVGLIVLILTLLKIVFYDAWNSIDNAIVRVIAFMFVGGIMIYISSLYKKNSLSISEDLSFSFSGEKVKVKDDGNSNSNVEILDKNVETFSENDFDKYLINKKIKKTDIGDKTAIIFIFSDGKKVKVRAKNLVKIASEIIKNSGKKTFIPGELKSTYDYILKNYKSELSKSDFNKILDIVEEFVKNGGSVEFE